ncbi:S41 family peptidase [Helicovermis profundi]|uniref:PDZ domain-containing protein n=1 Tax=Helicovermis profundi TaxID=3065157 RepID=A0AAU9E6K5_9FIRM|nr:hypothetical protein HLPR_27070 [Clostridia bacterium S502]
MKKNKLISILLILLLTFSALPTFADTTFNIDTSKVDKDYIDYLVNVISNNYKYDVTKKQLYEGMYKGIFETLDKHSRYFTPAEFKEFNVDTSGEFGGIGIVITANEGGYIRIVSPIEGTPGFEAGLKSKDLIVEVNGTDIKDWSIEKAVTVMRGTPGTKVSLAVKRDGEKELLKIDIIRDKIVINPVKYSVDNNNIGLLRITEFNNNTSQNVTKAIKEFNEKDVKGLIIDLRGNPGGLLSEVLDVADNFVKANKELLYVDYKGTDEDVYKSKRSPTYYGKPIVVLIDGGSASASEILTGILKDYKLAVIMGENSYGKGTVQTLKGSNEKGGFKLTIAEYLTPSRNKIDKVGIKPDLEIKSLKFVSRDDIDKLAPFAEKRSVSKLGDVSLNVYAAQERLNLIGYKIKVDGIYGKDTKQIIKEIQTKMHIKSDGILGKGTETKLNNEVEKISEGKGEDLQIKEAIKKILTLSTASVDK